MNSDSPLPSNRSFGILFVVVFGAIGGFRWLHAHHDAGLWFGAAAATLLVTLLKPAWLTPLNRAWMGLAALMHRVVSPVVLGVLYYGLFTPTGLVMRLFGRDVLHRRFDPAARSYWVERSPPGPDVSGLPNQF